MAKMANDWTVGQAFSWTASEWHHLEPTTVIDLEQNVYKGRIMLVSAD